MWLNYNRGHLSWGIINFEFLSYSQLVNIENSLMQDMNIKIDLNILWVSTWVWQECEIEYPKTQSTQVMLIWQKG